MTTMTTGAPGRTPPDDRSAEVRARLEDQWRRRVDEITDLSVRLHDARASRLVANDRDAGHAINRKCSTAS